MSVHVFSRLRAFVERSAERRHNPDARSSFALSANEAAVILAALRSPEAPRPEKATEAPGERERSEVAVLRGLLAELEWTIDEDGDDVCPICGAIKVNNIPAERRHFDDCRLAAALRTEPQPATGGEG